jgi:hypothetical protein
VSQDQAVRPALAATYRERAHQMLKRSENAESDEIRAEFLSLADHWLRLAQTLEEPKW